MYTKTSEATALEASLPPLGGARWNPLWGPSMEEMCMEQGQNSKVFGTQGRTLLKVC